MTIIVLVITFLKRRDNENDAEEILRIIKNRQLVTMVRQYEKPDDDGLIAMDETTYRLSFDFTDGTSKSAPIKAGEELISAFHALAVVNFHQS